MTDTAGRESQAQFMLEVYEVSGGGGLYGSGRSTSAFPIPAVGTKIKINALPTYTVKEVTLKITDEGGSVATHLLRIGV